MIDSEMEKGERSDEQTTLPEENKAMQLSALVSDNGHVTKSTYENEDRFFYA